MDIIYEIEIKDISHLLGNSSLDKQMYSIFCFVWKCSDFQATLITVQRKYSNCILWKIGLLRRSISWGIMFNQCSFINVSTLCHILGVTPILSIRTRLILTQGESHWTCVCLHTLQGTAHFCALKNYSFLPLLHVNSALAPLQCSCDKQNHL